jgi:hypothetical protein
VVTEQGATCQQLALCSCPCTALLKTFDLRDANAAVAATVLFRWSKGKVLFASGSPFFHISDDAGVVHYPAQANNAYIFPAVGFAAVLAKSREITDEMFVVAAGGPASCLITRGYAGDLSCCNRLKVHSE